MGRVVNVMQEAFWTSVPAFAVYLALTPHDGCLERSGQVLWWVVLGSSLFLTARAFPPVPGEVGEGLAQDRTGAVGKPDKYSRKPHEPA